MFNTNHLLNFAKSKNSEEVMATDSVNVSNKIYEQERNLRSRETLETNKEGSNPQQKLQLEMLQQSMKGDVVGGNNNLQKQLLQMMSAAAPLQQIQATAQNQISKGYLDIRI